MGCKVKYRYMGILMTYKIDNLSKTNLQVLLDLILHHEMYTFKLKSMPHTVIFFYSVSFNAFEIRKKK